MAKLTQTVWEALHNEPIILKGMHLGLINHRALARYLHKKYQLQVPLDSTISAIRRFEMTSAFSDQFETIPTLLKGSDVSTKNNISLVTLKNDINFFAEYAVFLQNIKTINRLKFRHVLAESIIKFIADSNDIALIEKTFKSHLVSIESQLGEIKIVIPQKLKNMKGVAARISNEISQSDINIKEIITCIPDFFMYVHEKDLPKAYTAIMNLCAR